jgi:hypothetical protein
LYICSALLDWYTIELFVGILLRYHLQPHSSLSFGGDNMTRYTFIIPDGDIDQLPRLLKREAAQASKFVENLLNE